MKKGIIIISIIAMIGIIAFMINDHRNKQIIGNEVTAVIEENIQKVYSGMYAEQYGITDIRYEITGIQKNKNKYINGDYSFAVKFSCNANSNLDPTERSLVAFAVEDILKPFTDREYETSNGLKISARNEKKSYIQSEININGELARKNGEKISSSGGSKPKSASADTRPQDAWNCATDVVRRELYNYTNVNVSSYNNSTVTYTASTGIYTIKGTVSYKNQLNAKVNNKFTVQLKLTEHGYSDSSILIY